MAHPIPATYRTPFLTGPDRELKRSLSVSSGFGVLVLLVVFLVPMQEITVTDVDEVPERLAKLILRKPEPVAAPAPLVAEVEAPALVEETPAVTPEPVPETAPPPTPTPETRRREAPVIAPDAGQAGREQAKAAVSAELATTTAAVSEAVGELREVLGGTRSETRTTARRRSGRAPNRSGNASLASVAAPGAVGAGDGSGSSLAVPSIRITTGAGPGGGGGATDGGSAVGGTRSAYRTDASLMAVVRRYAPGIEYCYDRELESTPGLRGKLTVAITVAASGSVTQAELVGDTVKSAGLATCVLGQIRTWRFPTIEEGVTVFRTPFVFTPPQAGGE